MKTRSIRIFLGRLLRFSGRVFTSFIKNRGILLAGGVGYNALLSLIPFLALTITGLSYFIKEKLILETIEEEFARIVPSHTDLLMTAIKGFLESRELVGTIGFIALIFFSSIAFRMLEEAITMIFERQQRDQKRSFWVSALLPYMFIGFLGLVLFLVTLIHGSLEALGQRSYQLLGIELSFASTINVVLQITSFATLVILFTAIYKVLPIARVSFRRAFVGGLSASVMWVVVARLLTYYFSSISLVNVIYGSLAAVVIVLLSMEAAAIILLLGAQVIAELELNAAVGLPWYTPRIKESSIQKSGKKPIEDDEIPSVDGGEAKEELGNIPQPEIELPLVEDEPRDALDTESTLDSKRSNKQIPSNFGVRSPPINRHSGIQSSTKKNEVS